MLVYADVLESCSSQLVLDDRGLVVARGEKLLDLGQRRRRGKVFGQSELGHGIPTDLGPRCEAGLSACLQYAERLCIEKSDTESPSKAVARTSHCTLVVWAEEDTHIGVHEIELVVRERRFLQMHTRQPVAC